jgi:uncharacterized protein YacL
METFGKIVFTVLAVVLGSFYSAYVLMKLWLWFIYPLSNNELTFVNSLGLLTIFSLLTHSFVKEKSQEEKSFTENLVKTFFTNLVVASISLGMGKVISLFM